MRDAIASFFDARFLSRLLATPRGRAFMLSFMAEAEESDEKGVFDALLERVSDPSLHRLVRRHVDDEAKHARMLRERVAAIVEKAGIAEPRVPRELSIVPRIDAMLGGVAERFVARESGIMEAYVLLQVVEERAVVQFPKIAAAFAVVDPESAAVVRAITADEKRHVLYARAINERYAPDGKTLSRTLAEYRAVEQRAFDENGAAFLRHALDVGLLDLRLPERILWRAMAAAA